jgi:hypothetical protein
MNYSEELEIYMDDDDDELFAKTTMEAVVAVEFVEILFRDFQEIVPWIPEK